MAILTKFYQTFLKLNNTLLPVETLVLADFSVSGTFPCTSFVSPKNIVH